MGSERIPSGLAPVSPNAFYLVEALTELLSPIPSQDPHLQGMIQNLSKKTSELISMNSILEDCIAILAPLGKGRDLNELERGMLLADLLGLAAKFESLFGIRNPKNYCIEKMCNFMKTHLRAL